MMILGLVLCILLIFLFWWWDTQFCVSPYVWCFPQTLKEASCDDEEI